MTERFRPSESRPQPDIFQRLEQAVGAIQDSESFRAYLDVQARFHRYSPNNVALILAQRPDASRVASYGDWPRLHRYVRRGEKAIKIVVPMFTTRIDAETGEEHRQVSFGVGNVFDLSQTEGEPLPQVDLPLLESDQGAQLYGLLTTAATRDGLRVEEAPALDGDTMGYYEPQRQRILLRHAAQLQMTKTLAHELAHHVGRHTQSDAASETVAEAVAYVVLAHYGLDSGQRSFPYIATWSRDRKLLQAAMGTIQQLSTRIIDRVELAHAATDGLPPVAGGAPQKTYSGYSEDGDSAMGPVAVFVHDADAEPYALRHEVYHSPTGFSWGYGGSGPADLARSILADHLGFVPSPALYQPFKAAHVARWQQGRPWQITSEEIAAFLARPAMQAALQEQRELDRLERESDELEAGTVDASLSLPDEDTPTL